MLTLFAIPSASTTISDVSAYSSGWGTEFLIVSVFIIGVLLAGMFASKFIKVVLAAARKVLGGRGKGGRRGRR